MTVKKVVGGTALVAAALTAAYLMRPVKPPPALVSGMQFPVGLGATVGDNTGTVCHMVEKDKDILTPKHKIPDRDFRHATENQKRAWVIEEFARDATEIGIACYSPRGTFFPDAVAQPQPRKCPECNGSDCISWSCPAHINEDLGICQLSGPNCIITFICCGSNCIASC